MGSTTSTRRAAWGQAGPPLTGLARARSARAALCGAALALLSACASTPPPSFGSPLASYDVSSEYGERRGLRRRPHYGIDLRAPRGAPVAAVADGEILFRGRKRGFGNLVMIDHGGEVVTYYAHLKDFAVESGARVARGQTIGFVGRTGNASGPHLHLELRERGEPVNPRRRIPL